MGKYSRRQLLPPVFRLNGAVEVLSREMIIKRGLLYGDRIRGYVMPQDRSIEIDTVLDLDLARTILRGSKHD